MAKSLISASIDTDLLIELRLKRINVSGKINELLRTFIGIEKITDTNAKDVIAKIQQTKIELMELQTQKNIIEEQAKQKEIERKKNIVVLGDD